MLKTFQFRIQKSISDSEFLFTFNVYQMADKDESDLVMVSNESETDSNPRPEALKSLYRLPGYKKNQLVLCKNYVLQW